LKSWIDEAIRTIKARKFHDIFTPSESSQTYNELPILYEANEPAINNPAPVYGIIDRLIVDKKNILLIDYKTHSHATPETASELAKSYIGQMSLYRNGIQRMWPDHTIKPGVLFTACEEIIWLD
jgi:ATP-dependent exoDNAse (exonuclease V) beta subunit